MLHRFEAELWLHAGEAAWHFVTLPHELSDDIEERTGSGRTGFGSVCVEVRIGATTWRTSLFPDATRAASVLPIKRVVRTAEDLTVGDAIAIELRVLDD